MRNIAARPGGPTLAGEIDGVKRKPLRVEKLGKRVVTAGMITVAMQKKEAGTRGGVRERAGDEAGRKRGEVPGEHGGGGRES